MKKSIYSLSIFAIFAILSLVLISCGGEKSLPKTDEGDMPDWYKNTPEDPNYIFAAASATSQDMELAVSKASTEARAEIARQLEIKVNSMQKKFEEEVGQGEDSQILSQFTQATKTIVSTELSGSKIAEKKLVKDGSNWIAYVLAEYPIGAAQKVFLDKISNNSELVTRFRSGQAFQELEKDVKEYEEFKKKN